MPPSQELNNEGQLSPVIANLLEVLSALAQAEAGSLVLNRTFSATQLLGNRHVGIGAVDLLQRVDFNRRPVLGAAVSVEATGCSGRASIPRGCASALAGRGGSSSAIHPLLLSHEDIVVNVTSS